jgi:hypothetical protein
VSPDQRRYVAYVAENLWRFVGNPAKVAIDWLDAHHGLMTGLATVAMAALTCALVKYAGNQEIIIQNQLTESKLGQRAWIAVYNAKAIRPLNRNPMGHLNFMASFALNNTGRLPARYVLIDADFFVRGPSAAELERVRQKCEGDRKRPINQTTQGITLFPSQSFDQPYGFVLSTTDEARLVSPRIDGVAPMIAGCVDYVLANSDEHHQTAFVFELDRSGPDGAVLAIDPKAIPISAAELLLEINPALAPNAD